MFRDFFNIISLDAFHMSFPNNTVRYFLINMQFTVLRMISSYCFISGGIKHFPEFLGRVHFAILAVFAFIEMFLPPNMQKKFTESKYYFSKVIIMKYQCRKKSCYPMTQPQKFPEGSCNKQSNKESKRKITYIRASFTQHWKGGHSPINHTHWKWDDF